MNAKTIAITLGIIFLVIGALGFVPNPLVGTGALFAATQALDIERVVSGLILLAIGFWSMRPVLWLRIVAAVYVLGLVYIFVVARSLATFTAVELGTAGGWLHIILGVLLIIAALIVRQEPVRLAA